MTKNIIFDLGGVLLNINYQLTKEAFQALGIQDFDLVYSQAEQTNLFDLLETGKISAEDFCDGIRSLAKIDSDNEAICGAWNAMLLNFPSERFAFLNRMGLEYDTFLLSNTNEIHLTEFNRIIASQNHAASLTDYFQKVYFSHEMGLRKPTIEAFNMVLDENQLKAEETIFIDDSIQHVEGAKKAGIEAYWLDTSKESVEDCLAFLLA